jgi:hypothetical protein
MLEPMDAVFCHRGAAWRKVQAGYQARVVRLLGGRGQPPIETPALFVEQRYADDFSFHENIGGSMLKLGHVPPKHSGGYRPLT